MVLINALLDDKSKNFSNKHDLPTPESPTMTSLKLKSSLVLGFGVRVLLLRVAIPPLLQPEEPLKLMLVYENSW